MSQKRKIRREAHGEKKQSAIQNASRKTTHVVSQIGNHYLGDKQSFSQRANANCEACQDSYGSDNAGDVLEKLEVDEALDCDTEFKWQDPDDNECGETASTSCVKGLLEAEGEGAACGFAPEMDAIHVVEMPDGKMRCVVEEDLGQLYFKAKNGYPLGDLREVARTKVYRAIAEWLNQLNNGDVSNQILAGIAELLKALKDNRPSRKEFCAENFCERGYEISASSLSNALKNAIIELPDGALPLDVLL